MVSEEGKNATKNLKLSNYQETFKNALKYFNIDDYSKYEEMLNKYDNCYQHPYITNKNVCILCGEKNALDNHMDMTLEEFITIYDIQLSKYTYQVESKNEYQISNDTANTQPHKKNESVHEIDKIEFLSGQLNNQLRKKKSKSHIIEIDNNTEIIPIKIDLSVQQNIEQANFLQTLRNPCEISVRNTESITKLQVAKKKKFDYCDICFSDIKDRFIIDCGHIFCKPCMTEFVSTCINNILLFRNLKCPKATCEMPIKENNINKLTDENLYLKYKKIKQKIAGISSGDYLPCPLPDCESYAQKKSISYNKAICIDNKHTFCVKCLQTKHTNKKCLGDLDADLIKQSNPHMIRKCPNCKCWVEKQEGCNNVTCVNIFCNYTFCWICMKEYEKSHYLNPLSECFGMSFFARQNRFYNNKLFRIFKCLLILILIMTIVIPLIILLFSFVLVVFYILTYVLDGSAVKNVKFKTDFKNKLFRHIVGAIYITMSLPLVSLGYIGLGIGLIASPLIYLIKNSKKEVDLIIK